jgi:putative transposase
MIAPCGPTGAPWANEELKREISRIHAANFGVYGVRKLWRGLIREGSPIGRDRARRLMTALGLGGVTRAKSIRRTQAGPLSQRSADLVNRTFTAPAPNRLWLADIERHEVLTNRAVMKGHRRQPVAAGW